MLATFAMTPGRLRFWLGGILLGAAVLAATAAAAARNEDRKEKSRTSAPHAILIDADGGSVLYERDADALVFPASLAKLMTVEYVFHLLKEGKIKPGDEFPISEYAWRHGGAPSRTSSMFAPIHSNVSVDNLLHSVIIQSGNDACIALAEGIAGSESAFATQADRAGPRIGADQVGLHQFDRTARPQPGRDGARTRHARPPHHPDLSGSL